MEGSQQQFYNTYKMGISEEDARSDSDGLAKLIEAEGLEFGGAARMFWDMEDIDIPISGHVMKNFSDKKLNVSFLSIFSWDRANKQDYHAIVLCMTGDFTASLGLRKKVHDFCSEKGYVSGTALYNPFCEPPC